MGLALSYIYLELSIPDESSDSCLGYIDHNVYSCLSLSG